MEDESKKGNAFLVAELIKQKSLSAKLGAKPSLARFVESGILKKDGELLVLSFTSPCCAFLTSEFLQDPIASQGLKSLDDALTFVKRVVKQMTDAGVTTGTSTFKKHFLKEFIVSSFSTEPLVSKEIVDLKFEKSFNELVNSICLAICELPIAVTQAYQIFRFCYQKNDGGYSIVGTTLETFSIDHGSELLRIALADPERPPGMIAHILCGYYSKDSAEVWKILTDLIQGGHEREAGFTITHLSLQSSTEVKTAVDLLEKIRHNDDTRSQLVFAYTTLISSPVSDDQTKSACATKLNLLAESGNAGVARTISYRLVGLPIADEIKVDIVSKFDYQREDIALSVFHLLQSLSPVLWFSVLRKICLTKKMDFDPHEIAYALKANYEQFKSEFSDQLVKLMTDNKGLARYGGCKVLQEINESDKFVFHTDLLSLDEQTQLIFIEALLTDFLHPEKVIRLLLIFRNSSHGSVLQSMINNCAMLIEDYMGQALKAFRSNLDKTVEIDAQVLKIVEDYYADLSRILETKLGILEFSPIHSQASLYNYYIRMSHDRMREQINVDRSNDKNSILSLFGKVMIARGRYWKLEGKDKPTPLSTIKRAITFPRTYFLNPDSYNWNIKIKILTDFNGGH